MPENPQQEEVEVEEESQEGQAFHWNVGVTLARIRGQQLQDTLKNNMPP